MDKFNVERLNNRFAIPNQLRFKIGPGELPVVQIANRYATAAVALHGGQVIAYQPRRQAPVIWLSEFSEYRLGKAIRGGIPLCWPWFGPHPTESDKPAHGLARIHMWEVLETQVVADEAAQIRLGLSNNDSTKTLWPYAFQLNVIITVGPDLQVELVARNNDDEAFTCGGALHTYFNISEIGDIKIHGLENCNYLDQVDADRYKTQQGPVTFVAETDRIYLETSADCLIEDPGLGRTIRVAKAGSHTTVVWNPWIDKSARMADFGDDEYESMVCVETANAEDDAVILQPGNEHRLATTIIVEEA